MGQKCSAECCKCDNEADGTYTEQRQQPCDPGDYDQGKKTKMIKVQAQACLDQNQDVSPDQASESGGNQAEYSPSRCFPRSSRVSPDQAFFPLPPSAGNISGVSPGQASRSGVSEASEHEPLNVSGSQEAMGGEQKEDGFVDVDQIDAEMEALEAKLAALKEKKKKATEAAAKEVKATAADSTMSAATIKERLPSQEDKKRSLKVLVDQFVSSAASGIPCTICYAVHGNSTFKSKATLLLDEKNNVVTFECSTSKLNIFQVPLVTVHVLDFDRYQKLRAPRTKALADVVVKALEPEEQKLGVLLVRQQGTVCIIADDEATKVTIQKSLGVLSSQAKALAEQQHLQEVDPSCGG